MKEFLLKKHIEDAKENSYWLGQLNNYYWYKTDMNTDYEKFVNDLTVEDVKNFTKALLDQGNIIEITMTAKEAKWISTR